MSITMTQETINPSFAHLPENYLVALTEYSAISLTGEEQSKYLQGQVTCDVKTVDTQHLMHGAHCNAKGKVLACFRLFNREGSHLLFQPKSTINDSFSALKKFGVFAKVDISIANNLSFFALIGDRASKILRDKYSLYA